MPVPSAGDFIPKEQEFKSLKYWVYSRPLSEDSKDKEF